MGQDTKRRSLTKAVTYRSLIICTDAVVVFFITHSYHATIAVVIISNITSTLMYFFHERLWSQIGWGRKAQERT